MDTVLKILFGIILGAVGVLVWDYSAVLQARKKGFVPGWISIETGESVTTLPATTQTPPAQPAQSAKPASPGQSAPPEKPAGDTPFGRKTDR